MDGVTAGRAAWARYTGPLLLGAFAAFIAYWYRIWCTSAALPSVDLPGHIAVVERLAAHCASGRLFFFDRGWFSGWPVFQFYGLVPHLSAAALTLPLRLVSPEPARLAVHLSLLAGCALLPFSMAFASAPLVGELCGGDRSLRARIDPLVAVIIGTLTFWFLNHDGQAAGIGAAAPMQIGLYPQLFAWHLVLLHAGSLYRVLLGNPPRAWLWLTLTAALLPLTHTMTAVFSFFLAGLAWCRFPDHRRVLAGSHVLAVGLTAFWLVPFLATVSGYTLQQMEGPAGDFLAQVFRYPLSEIPPTVAAWRQGFFVPLDPTPFALAGLTIVLLTHREIRRCSVLPAFAGFAVLSVVVFSSEYVAVSLPLGLHYYRFVAYALLLAVQLFTVVPVALLKPAAASESRFAVVRTAILLVTLLCLLVATQLPHPLQRLVEGPQARAAFTADDQVLDYFRRETAKGRVLFEYFKNYRTFSMIRPHYLSSRLFEETGFESINGLLIQSSLAYQFLVASAEALGIDIYGVPYLFTDQPARSDAVNLQQIAAFGVTHLVLSEPAGLARVRPFALAEPVVIGPYTVVKIAEPPLVPARYNTQRLVGYLDLRGTLPFKFVEFFFAAREPLARACDVLELDSRGTLPPGLVAVLVNGDAAAADAAVRAMEARSPGAAGVAPPRPREIAVAHRAGVAIDHYRPRYSEHPERDDYQRAARELDAVVPIAELADGPAALPPPAAPAFDWEPDGQSFRLNQLAPGRLLRINYSWLPYWRTRDGQLYRGGGERIYFLPSATAARVVYARDRAWSSRLGLALTAGSALVLFVAWRRRSER